MKKNYWLAFLFLAAISALAYLPLAAQIGYLNDDWYLMYAGKVGGASFFHEIYSIDRPLRGYLMQAAFSLFGMNVFSYHISAFVFRLLSGVALFWVLERLWKNNFSANLFAALLFLLYPGFLSQTNPIDYQSQIFSLACGMTSLALTAEFFEKRSKAARAALAFAAVLTGWLYLGLVEYFLGFEALRLMAIFLLVPRENLTGVVSRVKRILLAWLPFLAAPGGFLIWRLFFFEAERKATDVSAQLSGLLSPLGALWKLNYLIQDALNVLFTAWAYPLYTLVFPLRLREMTFALGYAAFAAALTFFAAQYFSSQDDSPRLNRQALVVGLLAVFAGLLPVILVNRHIAFPDYSRYALSPSIGAALMFAALVQNLAAPRARWAVFALLAALAVMTHYGNAARAVTETQATRNFWRQVAWRAIHIQPGTTLIASYPGSGLSEDYFIWAPANFIYYPEAQTTNPLQVALPAAVLNDETALQIISNGGSEAPLRRGIQLTRDYGNVLVMIQSSADSCVRVVNGDAPELSPVDSPRLFLIAPFSKLSSVQTEGKFPVLPADVFGAQPVRDWCYYYEQADFLRQVGEWGRVSDLLKEALDAGEYPNDKLEWMPFLQAAAAQGDVKFVQNTAKILSADRFLRKQACALMTDFAARENIGADVRAALDQGLCQ
ncbi:MAG: hypothetical protein Fur002_20610 [Anaerolineales bacterium]